MDSDIESELSEPTSELWRDLEQNAAKQLREIEDSSAEEPNDPPISPARGHKQQHPVHQHTEAAKAPITNGHVEEEIVGGEIPEDKPQDVIHQQTEAVQPPLTDAHDDKQIVNGKALDAKTAKSTVRAKATSAKKPVKSAAARKTDRLWEVDTVVTDSESPLVKINLQALLKKDEAWTSLSTKQQKKLLAMLPNAPTVEEDENGNLPNVLRTRLDSSAAMKADVRLFQEDLKTGKLEPEWQLMARRAMKRRANGDFDEFERQRREEIWSEKQDESEENDHDGKLNGKGKGKGSKKQKTKR